MTHLNITLIYVLALSHYCLHAPPLTVIPFYYFTKRNYAKQPLSLKHPPIGF